MGKFHETETLEVNPWYSKLELTLDYLKACFCRQGHGPTPRAGRELVGLKPERWLAVWISRFSMTLLSPNHAQDPHPEVSPSPERSGPVHEVSGLALHIWAWTQIRAEPLTARAGLETQLFPTVTGANSVCAMKSSINWHNNYNYMV